MLQNFHNYEVIQVNKKKKHKNHKIVLKVIYFIKALTKSKACKDHMNQNLPL